MCSGFIIALLITMTLTKLCRAKYVGRQSSRDLDQSNQLTTLNHATPIPIIFALSWIGGVYAPTP